MRFLALLLLFNPLCAALLLQFDVNGTILAFDKKTHTDVEGYLNRALYQSVHPYSLQAPREERTHFLENLRKADGPRLPEMEALYQKMWDKLKGEPAVFPSLFKLLDYLDRCHIPYTLSLRTFGIDLDDVVTIIEKERPGFFRAKGTFQDNVLYLEGEEPISDPLVQFQTFATGNYAIRGDSLAWRQHDRQWCYGKPFLLDPCSCDLPLFFDDNINPDPCSAYSVVDPIDARTGKHIPPARVANQLIHVETLEALLNDNYFIEKVQCALMCKRQAA